MRINIVLPAIGHSGGIDVINKYAELFSAQGHDVVLYKSLIAPNMHRYQNAAVNLVHKMYCTLKSLNVANSKGKYDDYVFGINDRTIRNADVIIATAWPTSYEISKLSPQKGKKYYFVQDFEIWDNEKIVLESYKLPCSKIVISSWINEQLYRKLGIGPFPIVYNGIDVKKFKNLSEENRASNDFLMLNHRLSKKGVREGLSVFEAIKEKYPDARMRMFGMCSNDNLPSYVEYVQNPTQEELVGLYNKSKYFLFSSLEEGWGLTPIEAIACGCLVIGTNTGFVKDLGIHKYNMMISDPGDIDGMTANCFQLMEDNELQRLLKNNSCDIINKLNWEKSSDEFLEILSEGKHH